MRTHSESCFTSNLSLPLADGRGGGVDGGSWFFLMRGQRVEQVSVGELEHFGSFW